MERPRLRPPPPFPVERTPAPAELLTAGLQELGLELPGVAVRPLVGLAELVARWSPRVNLTAHRTAADVVRHLVLDALALHVALPPANTLADLGSGAGFPGFPLAIADPERQVTLVESRERAHHFQRGVVRELELPNARVLRGRAEDLEPEPQDGVVAQAMGPPSRVAERARRWARPGGWIAIPYSSTPPAVDPIPGIAPEQPRHYEVPLAGPRRSIWLGRRT